MLRTISRAASALFVATTLGAQIPRAPAPVGQPDPLHQAGRNVTITLLTMGYGDGVDALFGHTAIWIQDNATRRDTVFNWGEYDRSKPGFIFHFVQGLLLYTMGGQHVSDLLYSYRYWNRSVTAQELDLSAAEKDSLLRMIQVNARPENVVYPYDYFVDNCATRPRDLIDRALGGQLRVGADSITATSYRWHTLRLMQGDKPLTLGVDIGLGEPSDKPITKWQAMFLPTQLHDWVATRQVRDSTGALHPLVKRERVLFQSTREPEATAAPRMGPALWTAGVVIAVLLGWLGVRATTTGGRGTRIGAAIALGLWATLCGLLGVILTLLWTATGHRFAYANENLLLFNPVWLVLAVMLPMSMVRGRASWATRRLVQVVASLGVLALVAHLVTLSKQDNLAVIGLALPVSLAIVYVVSIGRNKSVHAD